MKTALLSVLLAVPTMLAAQTSRCTSTAPDMRTVVESSRTGRGPVYDTLRSTKDGTWRTTTTCLIVRAITPPIPPSPPPSPSGSVVWFSDFAAGDIQDGGKWPIMGGEELAIVSGASVGFPTTNALRIRATAARNGFAAIRKTGLPVPAVGQSIFYRWYFRADWPDNLTDNGSHPIQDGQAASQTNWMFNVYHNNGGPGRWQPAFWTGSGIQTVWAHNRFEGPFLNKRVAYRFELQVHRVTTDGWQMHVRVYQGDSLVAGDAEFVGVDSRGSVTLAHVPTFRFFNVAHLEGLNAGLNDIDPQPAAGSPQFPFVYGYQGAFCVRTDTWCGPWR